MTKMTRLVSFGGNNHHPTPSSLTLTQQDVHLRVLDTIQALLAMPHQVPTCGSPLPLSTMYTTLFNVSLHVGNLSGPPLAPHSQLDTARTAKQGYKHPLSSLSPFPSHTMRTDVYLHIGNLTEPPQLPVGATRPTEWGYMPTSTSTPSCTTRTDIYQRVVDACCTTFGLIGQTLTCSTCSTCPPPLSMSTMPPPLHTAQLTESSQTSTCTFHSSSMLVTPDMSKRVENPVGTFQAPISSLMMKTTRLVSFGGNNHHQAPSILISTQKDMCLHVLETTQALSVLSGRVLTCDGSSSLLSSPTR
jgi:hypothetical protein